MRRKKPPLVLLVFVGILFLLSSLILFTQESEKLPTINPTTINQPGQTPTPTDPEHPPSQSEIDNLPQGTTSFTTLLNKGDQSFANRNFKQALVFYITANQQEPNNIKAYLKIIDTYLYTENIPIAEKNLELLRSANINSHEVIIRAARIKLMQSEPEAAINLLSNTTQNFENQIYQIIANSLIGNYTEAHQIAVNLNKGLESVEEPQPSKILAGKKLLQAYEIFSTFEDGNEVYLNTLLGQATLAVNEPKIAREFFYKAIEQDTNYRDSWIGLGYAFLKIKNYEEAENALNTARQRDPYKGETYFYQALLQGEQGNYRRAIGLFEQSRNQGFKDDLLIDQYLAVNFHAAKEYNNALPYFLKVIEQKVVPITYYVTPIWILLEVQDNKEQALEIANKAKENYPEEALSYNLLGWAHIYLNNYDAAKNNLNQALKLDPELAAAYLNYGLIFKQQNKLEAALPFFEKAEELALKQNDISIATRAEIEQKQIQLSLQNS